VVVLGCVCCWHQQQQHARHACVHACSRITCIKLPRVWVSVCADSCIGMCEWCCVVQGPQRGSGGDEGTGAVGNRGDACIWRGGPFLDEPVDDLCRCSTNPLSAAECAVCVGRCCHVFQQKVGIEGGVPATRPHRQCLNGLPLIQTHAKVILMAPTHISLQTD
jgi:hypothetical protein